MYQTILAAGRVERQHAVGVQRVAGVSPLEARPRLGLRRGPVDEIGAGVVAAGGPTVAADAEHQRRVTPGVAPGLARPRHRGCAPHFLAGLRIARGDEAGHVLGFVVTLAAIGAGHDPAVDDDRPGRVAEPEPVVGAGHVPHDVPGPGVERHDVRIDGGEIDLVVVDGEIAGGDDAGELFGLVLVPVAPEQLAGGRVERLDDAERAGDVEHAVVDQRVRLGPALGPDGPGPGELQPMRVLRVDLIQGAVAPSVERAPPVDPVRGVRIEQHLRGDRRERPLLRVDRDSRRRQGGGQHDRQDSDSHRTPPRS